MPERSRAFVSCAIWTIRRSPEFYTSFVVRNRAWGARRIRHELKARLVDYRQIEPALEQAFVETDERELLERTLEKKIRSLRLPLSRAKLASLCRSLLRHGFRAGDIIKAVRARPELKAVSEEESIQDATLEE